MKIISAKKTLGQNFLKSTKHAEVLIDSAEVTEGDTVLEIGPGKGKITEKLLERFCNVIAIEKDSRLIPILQERFEKEIKEKRLLLIEGDILEYNFQKILPGKYKVVASIPYNITGKLFPLFLGLEKQPEIISFVTQKEVAERIVAKDGKESKLSISIKVYGDPKYVATIPSKEFSPEPKVDSAIITVHNISRNFFDNDSKKESQFFSLMKNGFSSKRKKLSNNLKPYFKDNKTTLSKLNACGIDPDIRAERLELGEWKCLLDS